MRAAAAPEIDAPALPPLFRHHIRRPRLTRLLDASTSRLIVLTAPAGYGKTTLAAEWLQGRPEEEVAWYYASPAAADVAALSVGIAEAVSHILPAGDRVRQRLRVPQVPDNTADILAELLAGDLMEWPEKAWLVLDDYHHAMESKSAERFVEELVRLAPIRLLITTRRRPSWVTARRLVYGEVQEIRVDNLAMTSKEAHAMLRDHDSAKATAEMTRGWPALLGLAARAPTSAMHEESLAETQFQFLADEVLAQLPRRQRRLALQVSVLPKLSDKLLDACVEDFRGDRDVDALRHLGLLQRSGDSYTMHPLLRHSLREELGRIEPASVRRIAITAARHLEKVGDWDAAFTVAIDAGEVDLAGAIGGRGGRALVAEGRVETVTRWLSMLSREEHRGAELELLSAELLLRRSRFAEAAAVARSALAALPDGSPHQAQALSLLGEAHHMRSEAPEALAFHRQALRAARNPEDARRAAWGAWTAAHQLPNEDCAEELVVFKAVMGSDLTARLRAAVAEFLVRERQGTYAGSEALFASALRLSKRASDPMAVSATITMAAFHALVRAEYRHCNGLLDDLATYCARFHLSFARGITLCYQAAARIGLREFAGARASLVELRKFAEASEDPLVRLEYDTLDWRLRLVAEPDRRFDPAEIVPLPPAGQNLPAHAVADRGALQALALAAGGYPQLATERARELPSANATPVTKCLTALAHVVVALNSGTDSNAVRHHVQRAVRLADELACLDSLVMAYRLEPRLLEIAMTSSGVERILKPVLRRANDKVLARQHGIDLSDWDTDVPGGLTKRELEVIQLVCEGMTNDQIATRLFISRSTAKVHVHHILKKLGARNRLHAAAQWRDLAE